MSIDLITNSRAISRLTVLAPCEASERDQTTRSQAHFKWLHKEICREKKAFRSAAKARQFTVEFESRTPRINRRDQIKTTPYHCPVCKQWHLTSAEAQKGNS